VLLEVSAEHLLHKFKTKNLFTEMLDFIDLLRFQLLMHPFYLGVKCSSLFFVSRVYNEFICFLSSLLCNSGTTCSGCFNKRSLGSSNWFLWTFLLYIRFSLVHVQLRRCCSSFQSRTSSRWSSNGFRSCLNFFFNLLSWCSTCCRNTIFLSFV
jgi:hypothetical protein